MLKKPQARRGELTRVGDLPLFQEIAKELDLTPSNARLGDARVAIKEQAATIDDAAYMHVVFCHLGIPRSRRKERFFDRVYNRPHFHGAVRMEAGTLWDGKRFVEHPLPYGTKPRLVLLDILTTACRERTRFVEIGRTRRDYMRRLGIDPQGSEYRSFNQQTLALAACRMQLGMTYPSSGRVINIDAKPIQKFDAWLVPDGSTQQALWPGVMELSEPFFNGLEGSLVPIDARAAFSLDGALEMDIYFWLAQRLCRVRFKEGDLISWTALKEQFGQEYGLMKNFRREFIKALKQVLQVYQDARLAWDQNGNEGLRVYPSKPPIPKLRVLVPRLL